MGRPARGPEGFTVVELMIVVGIIAILAAIVIPGWTKEAHKGKGKTEATAMLAELRTKLLQYYTDNSTYVIGTTLVAGTATTCPASPSSSGYNFQTVCGTAGSAWASLRVQPPESTMYCSYSITVGNVGDTLTVPAGFLTSQGTSGAESNLAGSWFYIVATCDEDGAGGTNTTFYTSSVDAKTQSQNEGN